MKLLSLSTLLILLFPFILPAQHGIVFPEGPFRDSEPEDFAAKNLSSKFYNELWTYHIQLDNGVQIINTFSINDFGSFKGRTTGVKLSVSWTDGNTYVVNKEYGPETFTNEPDSNYIRLHPNRPYWAKGNFDGEHRLFFHNTKKGVQYDMDLTLYDIAKGKVKGNGVYQTDGNEIGLKLLMPHAKVKGMVAINGDTLQVTGTAYMDHIYQNNLSNKIIDRSYRLKFGDDENGQFLHFITLKKSGTNVHIGYGVGYKNGRTFQLTPADINRVVTDGNLDREVRIKSYQSDALQVKVDRHFNTYSILDELGSVKKFFAKKALGGELLELNGTATVNGKQSAYFYYLVAD